MSSAARTAALIALLALHAGAHAENAAAATVIAVPDASLRAMTGLQVRVHLRAVEQPAAPERERIIGAHFGITPAAAAAPRRRR